MRSLAVVIAAIIFIITSMVICLVVFSLYVAVCRLMLKLGGIGFWITGLEILGSMYP